MNNKKLVNLYHVGGRMGTLEFPKLSKFSHLLQNHIFEADETCIEQIKRINTDSIVLPYCLSNRKEKINFNLNYDPYTSSIYEFNKDHSNLYSEDKVHSKNVDKIFEYAFKTKEKIELNTETLDNIILKHSLGNASFLSLDTQGSELLILEGAKDQISKNLVGIVCEVSFTDTYKNQPLFDQINKFMKENNFIICDIDIEKVGFKRISRPLRGKKIPTEASVLYLLNPKSIISFNSDNIDRLYNLSFISLLYGYSEICFESLNKLKKLNHNFENNIITKFLNEFYELVLNEKNLPELWHNYYSYEQSKSRFETVKDNKFYERVIRVLGNFLSNPFKYLYIIIFFRIIFFKKKIRKISKRLPFKFYLKIKKKNKFQKFLSKYGIYFNDD